MRDTVFRSQDDHGASLDGLAGRQFEVVPAKNFAQDHQDLEHRIVQADAATGAATEGEVGEGRAQLVIAFDESVDVKLFRIRPMRRCMMRAVDVDNHRRSCGYDSVADAVVCDRNSVDHPERRVEAKGFLNDLRGVFELGHVAMAQWGIAEYGIELLAHAFEDIGTGTQKVQESRKGNWTKSRGRRPESCMLSLSTSSSVMPSPSL